MNQWDLNSIPWDIFDAKKVNPDVVVLAKTASVVEYNSADYVTYLCHVFTDNEAVKEDMRRWGEEEKQHGLALARWAKMADPSFDFEKSLERFREAYRLPIDATESVRGSRSAELVARCMVECGTTSYYSGLADVSEEPLFKRICKLIAMDEVHHYKLFYNHLQTYLKAEPMSVWERVWVVLSRGLEVNDDELLFAYAATNTSGAIRAALRAQYSREYLGRVFATYSLKNMRLGIQMAARAAGIENSPRLVDAISKIVFKAFQFKAKKLNRERQSNFAFLEQAVS